LAATTAVLSLAVTGVLSWGAWSIDRSNEHRLLRLQSRQAASVISSAIVGISAPLAAAVEVADATAGSGSRFGEVMAGSVGPSRPFVSASLWALRGATPILVASIGATQTAEHRAARALVTTATHSQSFAVRSVLVNGSQRVAYAFSNGSSSRFAVYAERAIPANHRVPVESDAAFADLHFATYLGSTERPAALQTTDLPPRALPLHGLTVHTVIPFGASHLLLVTSPSSHLGGGLEQYVWCGLLVAGVVIAAASTAGAWNVEHRRHAAEANAATLTSLYGAVNRLYAEQRTISSTLQHALLPQRNPPIPGLEVASRYAAGAQGVDVGGDWYSIVRVGEDCFAFVVGDVSGRGVEAAALMARLRFTLRAYLLEGHSPDIALSMASAQLSVEEDHHLATVLVGTGEVHSRRIVLANAGHLDPLLIEAAGCRFLPTRPGPPLGVAKTVYQPTAVVLRPGPGLLLFTDGLVERRREDLKDGLARLAQAAQSSLGGSLETLCESVLSKLTAGATEDDVAMLTFRWQVDTDDVVSPGSR
jgi:serine phosphatase RsbU (regulator of sigma subunit)